MNEQDLLAIKEDWPEPLGVFIVIGGSHDFGPQIVDTIEDAGGKAIVLDVGGPLHPGVTYYEVDVFESSSVQQTLDAVMQNFATVDGVIAVASTDNDLTGAANVLRASMQTLMQVNAKVVILDNGAPSAQGFANSVTAKAQNEVSVKMLDIKTRPDVLSNLVEELSN